MPRFHILIPSLYRDDAVGHDALMARDSLSGAGHEAHIYAQHHGEDVEGVLAPESLAGNLDASDTVIYQFSIGWDAGVRMLRAARARRVVRYHNITPAGFFAPYSRDLYELCRAGRAEVRRLARLGCELYLSNSGFSSAELVGEGAPPERCGVVPPFGKAEGIDALEADPAALGRYGDGRTNILSVGRLSPNKGHRGLLDAFSIYHKAFNPDSRLIIVGPSDVRLGAYEAELRERIRLLGIDGAVVFTGAVTDAGLKAFYKLSHALLMTSGHEGFGVPLAEAMYFGLPIVASGSSAVPETLGGAAVRFEDDEPRRLAQALDELMRDPGLARGLAESQRQRYTREFSEDAIRKKLLKALEDGTPPPSVEAGRDTPVVEDLKLRVKEKAAACAGRTAAQAEVIEGIRRGPDMRTSKEPRVRISDMLISARSALKRAAYRVLGDNGRIIAALKALDARLRGLYFLRSAARRRGRGPVVKDAPFGVNVAGFLTGEFGLGEAARSDIRSLESAGVPCVANNFLAPHHSGKDVSVKEMSRDNPYMFNLVHVNMDVFQEFHMSRGEGYFDGKYNIAFWVWEFPEVPDRFSGCYSFFDEIWTPSSFSAAAFSRKSPVPVLRMPHSIDVGPAGVRPDRQRFGLKGGEFVFLVMFDFISFYERKNPLGAIRAFREAFGGGEGVRLVVKHINSKVHPSALKTVDGALAGLNHTVIDAHMRRDEVRSLVASCDCYVSLHRSEGFGLTIAEAMALGKPVIATNYSGNTDFMDATNGFPVDYTLSALDKDFPPYEKGSVWAEPDTSHAAGLMRKVCEDKGLREEVGEKAARDIRDRFSPAAVGRLYRERLEFVRAGTRTETVRGKVA